MVHCRLATLVMAGSLMACTRLGFQVLSDGPASHPGDRALDREGGGEGAGPGLDTRSDRIWTEGGSQAPRHVWSKGLISTVTLYGRGVAVDGLGNAYFAGDLQGQVDFGRGPLVSAGVYDVFLASYGPKDVPRWAKRFGASGIDVGRAVAADGSGNVYTTGHFYDAVTFGGSTVVTSAGSSDIFLAAHDSSGTHRWSSRYGASSFDDGQGLAVDQAGNVYVTGYFNGTVSFGGGSFTSAGTNDIFVASFTSAGVHRWSQRFGSAGADTGLAAAVGGNGKVCITGYFAQEVGFGGTSLVSAGSYDIFIACFTSSTGVHVWSKGFGSTAEDQGVGVAADASGNTYLTGSYAGTVSFGGPPLRAPPSGSSGGIFLASFSPTGDHRWSTSAGAATGSGKAVAVDGAANVYVTGSFSGTGSFGGESLISTGNQIFAASYTTSGSHRWSRSFGPGGGVGNGVAVDKSGGVFLVGNYTGPVDFGGGALSQSGVFLVMLAQ